MPLFSCCGPKTSTRAVQYADEPLSENSAQTETVNNHIKKSKVSFKDYVTVEDENYSLEMKTGENVINSHEDSEFFFSCKEYLEDIDDSTRVSLINFMRDNLNEGSMKSDFYLKPTVMEKDDDFSDMKYAPATVAYDSKPLGLSLDKPKTLLSSFHHSMADNKKTTKATVDKSFALRQTMVLKESLEMPSIIIKSPGYPGELTEEEVEKVVEFRRRLMAGKKDARELVLAQFGSETDEYALCRWLRSRKFDVDKTMEFVTEGLPIFKEGKKHKFYPSKSISITYSIHIILVYPQIMCYCELLTSSFFVLIKYYCNVRYRQITRCTIIFGSITVSLHVQWLWEEWMSSPILPRREYEHRWIGMSYKS